MSLPYADVVAASTAVAATRSRLAKQSALAAVLRAAPTDEVEIVAAHLSGVLPQGRVGVGHRSLGSVAPAAASSLTVADVDAALTGLATTSGKGSQTARRELLDDLLGRATPAEQDFLRALLVGELRQGALDGVLLPAVAEAFDVPLAAVRRGVLLAGHASVVAGIAARDGAAGLVAVSLQVGRPLRPMLAGSAPTVAQALGAEAADAEAVVADASDASDAGSPDPGAPDAAVVRPVALVQCKLDGIRIQVHRRGDAVRVFTRSLDDITDRVPEVVEAVLALPATDLVLDGEAIALRPDGRPQPFQVTGARTASRGAVDTLRAKTPLTTYLFDLLHLDGRDLVNEPLVTRWELLTGLAPTHLPPTLTTTSVLDAERFFDDLVAAGQEGVVVKDLDAPYAAGRRGSAWTKVKPRHTLDLVVLAVEWGSGRRKGTLSNIHLGARDGDRFVMLGKTFKGMTDEMLAWQTQRFLALEESRDDWTVRVRPEQVVEVAFDGLQTSTRYPGGVALRFARVLRYRDDKTAAEADTLDTVLRLAATMRGE